MPEPGSPTTVSDVLNEVTAVIDQADVGDTSRLDAELLVGHVAGLDRVGLRVQSDRVFEPEQWQRLDALVGRRCSGEPIAYLLESAWFYGRAFAVDRRVLIPRPETELLVELVLAHVADARGPSTIVDACTGSGCVAISIAAELGERVRVLATDLSGEALQVAAANAARHGVDIELHEGDLLEPVAGRSGDVSVVVANPPYVEGIDDSDLERGVRDFEPHVALFLPTGGIAAIYARLASQAMAMLVPGGLFAVEHGVGQRLQVQTACRAAGFVDVDGVDDHAGIDRVVTARTVRAGTEFACSS